MNRRKSHKFIKMEKLYSMKLCNWFVLLVFALCVPMRGMTLSISTVNHINLQIASLNCNGLIDSAKRRTLFEWFEKSRFQILLLQETHFAPEQHLGIVRRWKQGPIF